MARRYDERRTRGHGGCGFFLTLILAAAVIVGLLLFSTNLLDSYKNKVYEFFYPREYALEVSAASAEYGVDDALIYAVIRCESGFREQVESHAGAVGLMQLMPETFEWLQSSRDGEVTMSAASLLDPSVNIEYGTYLLHILLDKYDGNEATAVAAYNAGSTNVDSWLSDPAYSIDGMNLSTIPYEETKKYVEQVEKTKEMYKKLYDTDTK